MIAVWEQVRRFAMPGEGIEDFDAHSAAISDVGIFGAEQLLTEVFEPIVGEWASRPQPGSAPTPSGPGRGSSVASRRCAGARELALAGASRVLEETPRWVVDPDRPTGNRRWACRRPRAWRTPRPVRPQEQ